MQIRWEGTHNNRPHYLLSLDEREAHAYLEAAPGESLVGVYANWYDPKEFRLIKDSQSGLSGFTRLPLRGWKATLGANQSNLASIVQESKNQPREMKWVGDICVGYASLALTSSREE